jgi:hypothetical protein
LLCGYEWRACHCVVLYQPKNMSKRKSEDDNDDKSVILQVSRQKRIKRDLKDIHYNGFVIQLRSQKQREEQRFVWFLWAANDPHNYTVSLKGPLGGFDWIKFKDNHIAVMHGPECECDDCYESGWRPKREDTWQMTQVDEAAQPNYNARAGLFCTRKRATATVLYWLHFDTNRAKQDIHHSTRFMPPLVGLVMGYFEDREKVHLSSMDGFGCDVLVQTDRIVTDFVVVH